MAVAGRTLARVQFVVVVAMLIGGAKAGVSQRVDAVMVGAVLTDSTHAPIEGAEVSMPGIGKRVVSAGGGRFRIDNIRAGTHEIIVRQIGYSPYVMHIAFATGDSVERIVVLRRIPSLETITVQASAIIPSFEEHRAVGLGTFITRADLQKQEGRTLSSVVSQIRGVRLLQGMGGRAWLYSSRRSVTSIMPSGTSRSSLDRADRAAGAASGLCYADVYVDEKPMYRGLPEEPLFDINSLTPSAVEAIELYAGPSSTPLRYSRLNSNCGVIVIHTRRSFDTPKKP